MHDELLQTRKTYSLSNLQPEGLTPLALKAGTSGNYTALKAGTSGNYTACEDTLYVYPRRIQILEGTYRASCILLVIPRTGS